MKIIITLSNSAGPLDTLDDLDTGDFYNSAEVSEVIWEAINHSAWVLAPGYTIQINEVAR